MKVKMFEVTDIKDRAHCAFLLSSFALRLLSPTNLSDHFLQVENTTKLSALALMEITFSAASFLRGKIEQRLLDNSKNLFEWAIKNVEVEQTDQIGIGNKKSLEKGLRIIEGATLSPEELFMEMNLEVLCNCDPDAIFLPRERAMLISKHFTVVLMAFHALMFQSTITVVVPKEHLDSLLEDLQLQTSLFISIKWNNCSKLGFNTMISSLGVLRHLMTSIGSEMEIVKDPELGVVDSVDFLIKEATDLAQKGNSPN